jgi:hypothetical protein
MLAQQNSGSPSNKKAAQARIDANGYRRTAQA